MGRSGAREVDSTVSALFLMLEIERKGKFVNEGDLDRNSLEKSVLPIFSFLFSPFFLLQ